MKKQCNIKKEKEDSGNLESHLGGTVSESGRASLSYVREQSGEDSVQIRAQQTFCIQAQRVNVQALGLMRGSQLCRGSTKAATDSMQLCVSKT